MPPDSCSCGCVNTFSTQQAEGDLKRYRQKGPDATTRALIDAIRAQGVNGSSLLDVGGGIGAISLALLDAGLASSHSVEATEAYVAVARSEAQRRGFADRATHRFGTLEELAGEVGPADIVTLDKVLCCDADLSTLLQEVSTRARRMVGLVYPRSTWWNRLAAHAIGTFGWLTRDPTRWYLHPDSEVDAMLRDAGFERRDVDRTLVWQVALYLRTA